ncbi:hypothetical protein WA026_015135 [Henosepilachna vigintioctopunctata]|uniref:Endonuclease/exonuclease/phosphatase domain-containing protein n=1 Tax=Henosepilachna vigintioctopunctata TaxID=420089 RepID=A0AAW1TKT1_9CUCU
MSYINIPPRFQNLEIKIQNIPYVNKYNLPDIRLPDMLFNEICLYLPETFFLLGDLNAQNPTWGSEWLNNSSREIENFIREESIIILNNDPPTRFSSK